MKVTIAVFACALAFAAVAHGAAVETEAAASGWECEICEFVVSEVEKLLADNATQSEILADTEKICDIFGNSTIGTECDALVETYLPDIINLLLNSYDPSLLCEKITLCSNSSELVGDSKSAPQSTTPIHYYECVVCDFAVGVIEVIVRDGNKTEQEIIDEANAECEKLTGWFESECLFVVETIGIDVIGQLLNGSAADGICEDAGLCPSPSTMAIEAEEAARANGPNAVSPRCQACSVVSLVTAAAGDAVPSRRALLDKCGSLPGDDLKMQCALVVAGKGCDYCEGGKAL